MGNKNVKSDTGTRKKVGKDDFVPLCCIGRGNYADVLLVKKKDTGAFFAMKILRKAMLILKDEVEHTQTERKILGLADHPFLVKMHSAFQTATKLYIVMQFSNGGELFSHLKRVKRFSEEQARFYAAEIILALEYLHTGGAIYRDLKPENTLLDPEGHICLTDFGLSKIIRDEGRTKTFCGTPEYLAPEVLLNKPYGKEIDYWALGTLLFEMLVGLPPFYSKNVQEMYEMILFQPLVIPDFVSKNAADLLRKLLVRNPSKRLGTGVDGAADVKAHPFFDGVDWEALLRKETQAPFKPTVDGPGDVRYVSPTFIRLSSAAIEEYYSDGPAKASPTFQRLATAPADEPPREQPRTIPSVASSTAQNPHYHFDGFTFEASAAEGGNLIHQEYTDPVGPNPLVEINSTAA